jgi:hypothetical protein
VEIIDSKEREMCIFNEITGHHVFDQSYSKKYFKIMVRMSWAIKKKNLKPKV